MSSESKSASMTEKLSKTLKEPFNLVKRLRDMKVLGKNSDPKYLLPNVIVLGEETAGISVIRQLSGLNLPSNLEFPLVLRYTSKSSSTSN